MWLAFVVGAAILVRTSIVINGITNEKIRLNNK
jgi:hypothetical protein